MLRSSSRHQSHSCPTAIERNPEQASEGCRFPPHFENYLQAALSGEQPEDRLCFPKSGVIINVEFSICTTSESVREEPTIFAQLRAF